MPGVNGDEVHVIGSVHFEFLFSAVVIVLVADASEVFDESIVIQQVEVRTQCSWDVRGRKRDLWFVQKRDAVLVEGVPYQLLSPGAVRRRSTALNPHFEIVRHCWGSRERSHL